MSKECPLCGFNLPDDATECSTCGERFEGAAPQQAEVECPSCMSLVPAGVVECPICGEKIAAPAADTPRQEAEFVPEPAPVQPVAAKATRECPECGSITEAEAIECAICGFKFEYEGLDMPVQQSKPVDDLTLEPDPFEEPSAVVEEPKGEPEWVEPSKTTAPMAAEKPADVEATVRCPACKEKIKAGDAACPLCGAIISDYTVICPACRAQVPAIDEVCPECFATLSEAQAEVSEMGVEPLPEVAQPDPDYVKSATPSEAVLDTAEGRECLVCFAILAENENDCPVCRLPFGTQLPPEEEVEQLWEGIGIEIPKDYYKCPNCEALLTDTEPSDCEVAERKWFFRAIIFLFTGIFISSASIWVRGVTAEMKEQGLSPTPMDAVVNSIGWILVIIGFVFWFFSWRAAGKAKLCPSCGCDVKSDATTCPECGECLEILDEQGIDGAEKEAGERA